MATKRAPLFFAAACLLLAAAAHAQEAADFSHAIGADGLPVFTQILRWQGDENAGGYELVVERTDAGAAAAEIVRVRTTEAACPVSLGPGEYRFRVVTYNLLGQAEAESGWAPLVVLKAELPRIDATAPAILYMDALDGRVELRGEGFTPDCRVELRGEAAAFEGAVVERTGKSELVVVFPDEAYQAGVYDLAVANPGGLTAVAAGSLTVRFQRPFDLLASAGYSPQFFLGDPWVKSVWPSAAYPLGLEAALAVYFVKERWGFVGLEAQVQFRSMEGGTADALLKSGYTLYGIGALYKYRFTRRVHGVLRLGGGLADSRHVFSYGGVAGPAITSLDPYAAAGAALQFFLPNKVFFEAGVAFSDIFLMNASAFALAPTLRAGYQLY